MEEIKINRPPSVWIAQTVLLLLAAVSALPFLLLFVVPVGGPPLMLVSILVYDLATGVLCVVAFCGLVRRRRYGRWIAVGLLGLLVAWNLVLGYFSAPGSIIQVIIWCFLISLIYRLTFGSAANAFFAEPTPDE